MKKVLFVVSGTLLPALLFLAACDRGKPAPNQGNTPKATGTQPPVTDVKTVGVDAVAKDPKANAGRVGIEGVVALVFKERGTFTIIDVAEFQKCGETGCAEYSVPVQVLKEEFEGELPKSQETVLAIGDVQPTENGYRFVVEEVRRKGTVILHRTKSPSVGK